MSKTNTGLVAYAKAQLGKPYWYGTFGQIATEALYKSKKKQYPDQYIPTDFPSQYGHRVHDCVGLIKGYLWSDSTTSTPKYNAAQDVSANGMRSKCTKKGSIGSIPEVPGVLVFLDGHVGVYIGGGYVIEARGHKYGVVKTKLKDRPWTSWGYCPYITYSEPKKETTTTTTTTKKKSVEEIAREVIAGKWGNGETRKKKLVAAGYNYTEVQAMVTKLLTPTVAKTIKVGSKVKIKAGAKSYEGKIVAPWVYLKAYTVDELKGDRAVLNRKGICTAFNIKDLIIQ